MARNLVICCDGTWNTSTQKDRGQVVPSNVVKMARLVDEDSQSAKQIVYYDTGVGTGRGLDKWTGGGLGIGLTDNIIQAYKWIASNYENGDQLYLFGFSRGAYTVRSLAGLIGHCGLTAPDNKLIEQAYGLYREASDKQGEARAAEFKQAQRQLPVHFLGVWDTVGALGVPALSRYGLLRQGIKFICSTTGMLKKYAHGFHSMELGDHINHAYHALAIDEKRGPFEPSLWKKKEANNHTKVMQVWFPGVHSNIGGGYADTGISDHALMWMAVKARDAGLQLNNRYLALRLDPNAHGELRDSMTAVYKALPKYVRKIGLPGTLAEYLHFSVRTRIEHPTNADYPPKNLLPVVTLQEIMGMRKVTDSKVEFDASSQGVIQKIRGASSISTWSQPAKRETESTPG